MKFLKQFLAAVKWITIGILFGVETGLCQVHGREVLIGPPSRNSVLGLKNCKLSEGQIEVLLRQGFLVTEKRRNGISDLYDVFDPEDGELATLVTTDSLLEPVMEAAFLVFRKIWAKEGRDLPRVLSEWIQRLMKMGPGPWPVAWKKGCGILAVSLGILEGKGALVGLELPIDVKHAAAEELGRISVGRPDFSPLLDRLIDYSLQSFPNGMLRGGIVGDWVPMAKLRAWLGQGVLLLGDKIQTRTAFLLAETSPEEWNKAVSMERALVGPLENLGINEYKAALLQSGGLERVQADPRSLKKALSFLIKKPVNGKIYLSCGGDPILALSVPSRYNREEKTIKVPSIPKNFRTSFFASKLGKGMILDGQGSSPGADVLQWGTWNKKAHPSGLLLAGGAGNSVAVQKVRAYSLKYPDGVPWRPGLTGGEIDWNLVQSFLDPRPDLSSSVQGKFWNLFRVLAKDQPGDWSNPEWFFSGVKWKEMRARTALAGWVLWRRAAGPSVRRASCLIASSGYREKGYIIPTQCELRAFHEFVASLKNVCEGRIPAGTEILRAEKLVEKVLCMRKKQDEGEPWNESDQEFFAHYGDHLKLRKDEGCGNRFREIQPHAYVCDIGTLATKGENRFWGTEPEVKFLAGLALPRRIYGIVRIGGRWYLARGGILDYREFVIPVNMTLGDPEWKMIFKSFPDAGKLEPPPSDGGKSLGFKERIRKALLQKNPFVLESTVLSLLQNNKNYEKELEVVLGRALEIERKRTRDLWAWEITGEKYRPGGLKGLLFSLKLLWSGETDLSILPGEKRKSWALEAALVASKRGVFPHRFFEVLIRVDLRTWIQCFESWIRGMKKIGPLLATKILGDFLIFPKNGTHSMIPEATRKLLAGEVIEKSREGLLEALARRGRALKKRVWVSLFLSPSPEGLALADEALAKDPKGFLEELLPNGGLGAVSLPPDSIHFLEMKVRNGVPDADLYFEILYVLLRNGKEVDEKSAELGWRIFQGKFFGNSSLNRSKREGLKSGFYPEDCFSVLILANPKKILGEFWKKISGLKGGREKEELLGLLNKSLFMVYKKISSSEFTCKGREKLFIQKPPRVSLENGALNLKEVDSWLKRIRKNWFWRKERGGA